jgi:hypothetical protein
MGLEPGLCGVRVDGVDLSYSAKHALSGRPTSTSPRPAQALAAPQAWY